MVKAKYKPGDILTCWQFDKCVMTTVIVKPSVEEFYCDCDCYDYALKKQYIKYDILSVCKASDGFRMELGIPERTYDCYRLTGHIDISDMSIEEIKKNLDCAIKFECCDNRIAHAIQEHWLFYKLNDYCCYSVQDKLKYDLKMANEAKEELKKELERLQRDCRCGKARAAYKLHEIGFTNDKIGEILGETPCVVSYLLSGRVN